MHFIYKWRKKRHMIWSTLVAGAAQLSTVRCFHSSSLSFAF
jgi:hypothetical protein